MSCVLLKRVQWACADPESFSEGVQLSQRCFFVVVFWFFFAVLFLMGGSKYHLIRAIIGPQAQRHLNGVSLACQ